jgi:hypothetical protein
VHLELGLVHLLLLPSGAVRRLTARSARSTTLVLRVFFFSCPSKGGLVA